MIFYPIIVVFCEIICKDKEFFVILHPKNQIYGYE